MDKQARLYILKIANEKKTYPVSRFATSPGAVGLTTGLGTTGLLGTGGILLRERLKRDLAERTHGRVITPAVSAVHNYVDRFLKALTTKRILGAAAVAGTLAGGTAAGVTLANRAINVRGYKGRIATRSRYDWEK